MPSKDQREELIAALGCFTNCMRNKVLAANKLHDDGWVKPVRCGECAAWPPDSDMSNMKDEDKTDRRWCVIRRGYVRADGYCSEGESKVVEG